MKQESAVVVGALLVAMLASAKVLEAGACDLSASGSSCQDFAGLSWLDSNSSKANISLEKLQSFLSLANSGVQGVHTGKVTGLAAIYDVDSGGNDWLHLNYDLGEGSGSANMVVYVPNGRSGANLDLDSFDPNLVGAAAAVSEPAGLLLLGSAVVLAVGRFRRRLLT